MNSELRLKASEIEKHLARAIALARVLSFGIRNQQREPIERCSKLLGEEMDSASGLLLEIARDTKAGAR